MLSNTLALLADSFEQAKLSLADNKVRTIMSIIGVAVGIAAVMMVGIVSQSGRNYIFAELETYGLRTLWVNRDWENNNPFESVREGSGINNDDLLVLKGACCSALERLSPVVYPEEWQVSVRQGNNFSHASVEGVGADYLLINNDHLLMGRNFREDEIRYKRPVAIIGSVTREKLFGKHRSPLGKSIRLGDLKLIIIGVLQKKDRTLLSAVGAADNYDINERVLISFLLYQQYIGSKDIQQIVAQATRLDQIEVALEQITTTLNRRHNHHYRYRSDSMRRWIDNANFILNMIYMTGIFAASLSLFVGGIGVLNIMSTSVLERTREIGLRKALGATQQDILRQFLAEAMMISSLGGGMGCLIGLAGMLALEWWSGLDLTVPWFIVSIAVVVSIGVGLLSGLYPAQRAARLPPMHALRYE